MRTDAARMCVKVLMDQAKVRQTTEACSTQNKHVRPSPALPAPFAIPCPPWRAWLLQALAQQPQQGSVYCRLRCLRPARWPPPLSPNEQHALRKQGKFHIIVWLPYSHMDCLCVPSISVSSFELIWTTSSMVFLKCCSCSRHNEIRAMAETRMKWGSLIAPLKDSVSVRYQLTNFDELRRSALLFWTVGSNHTRIPEQNQYEFCLAWSMHAHNSKGSLLLCQCALDHVMRFRTLTTVVRMVVRVANRTVVVIHMNFGIQDFGARKHLS